ncbi:molybdopterin synthase sulfur carrier subunit [Simiduia litorea]|uniref:molybdopterin converting factor subunit 1 n=1 Tax=Simiduia litorea TaxID=1435348 RepID=UPI0036F1B478
MIQIKFFARLRDQLGTADLQLPYEKIQQVADVQTALIKQHPDWQDVLMAANILVAVNETMSHKNSDVSDGDEIAFFPPVTGG